MASLDRLEVVGDKLTEAYIQRGLIEALQWEGFSVYHTRFSLDSESGFPDICAVHETSGRMVVIECKGPRGRVSPEQRDWIERFRLVPGCVFSEVVGPDERPGEWWGYDDALDIIRGLGADDV